MGKSAFVAKLAIALEKVLANIIIGSFATMREHAVLPSSASTSPKKFAGNVRKIAVTCGRGRKIRVMRWDSLPGCDEAGRGKQ